jgi:hypothetical protein
MMVHTIGIPREFFNERNMWKSRVIQPKDYEPKTLQLEDPAQDGGLYVGYDRSLLSGRRVKREGLPTRVRWSDKRPVPDFQISYAPTMIVSQLFRDVVEHVEPGVHQFEPVEYVGKDGVHVANMFVFVICNRIDSVDRERTTMYRFKNFWQAAGPTGGSRLVFNAAQVGDHHLWIDKYLPDFRLASSDFVTAAREARLVGVSFREWETV